MKTLDIKGVPRWVKMAAQLREDIARGRLRSGDRLPSFAQVRARDGISQATWDKVHSALEIEGLISREPGRGVFVAAPKIAISRSATLKSETRGAIGLAGYGFGAGAGSSYWAEIFEGIRVACDRAGTGVMLMTSEAGASWNAIDGALLCDYAPLHAPPEARDLPFVSLLAPIEGIANVRADDYGATRALTAHLISLGHEKIAYLHGRASAFSRPRLEGYRDALEKAGITPHPNWQRALSDAAEFGAEFIRVGQDSMRRWIEDPSADGWNKSGCTALLAHNDETAIGAIEALRAAGIEVPRDVSVAGFDGLDFGAYYVPRLTTVEVPLREIGASAARKLLSLIEGNAAHDSPQNQALPCVLRVRESTARRR